MTLNIITFALQPVEQRMYAGVWEEGWGTGGERDHQSLQETVGIIAPTVSFAVLVLP